MSDEPPARHRVLVADDDAAIRHGISKLLEKAGFEVSEAADGIAALNAIQEKPFDLVFASVRSSRMLMFRIADPGPGFSFEGLSHAAVGQPESEPIAHMSVREEQGIRPGGFGILMTKAGADELLYNEAQNEVLFVKYFDNAQTMPAKKAG